MEAQGGGQGNKWRRDQGPSCFRDADRPAALVLLIDGVPQSHVDLDDPGYLDFEYVRRLGHVIDAAAPAGPPLRVCTWGPGRSRWPATWRRPGPARRSWRWRLDAALVNLIRLRLPPRNPRLRIRVGDARAELERHAARLVRRRGRREHLDEKGVLVGIDATGPVDNVTERAIAALRPFA